MQGDEESPMSMQVSLNTSSILVVLTEGEQYMTKMSLREKITIAFLLGIALKTDAVVISTIILVAMVIFEHIKLES